MSDTITNTRLWSKTLAVQQGSDPASTARERLRNVFVRFRERVAMLVGEIHRDLPDLTVHDITHLDALWEMADLISGPNYVLTPTEAFVLGGAILLHDAGMGLASYPNGLAGLQQESQWADLVTSQYRAQFSRLPTPEEIAAPVESVRKTVTGSMLRSLHAKHAEKLTSIAFKAKPTDPPQFLIDDNEIRQSFGRLIGLIAHSHWWPINKVESEFSRALGSPHWCPNGWTVDPLKVACLLRVADAGHIDARRAPTFLKALRKPVPGSDVHWSFQEKLQKPHLAEDAIAYTSGYAFTLNEASAWWMCLDTLTMIDRELRQVDALLADKGLNRFAGRRVAGIESPERLVSYIPTDGWLPVNAQVQVTDVPKLVESLGGKELYGNDRSVPIRELIQNSADAIRARRIVEKRDQKWGSITVRLGKDENGEWLEVEDNGIGMSSEVLTRYLLDFGKSYWASSHMLEEFPGLLSAGFKATGKYGIGFFSIFMLGSSVQIRTRRSAAARGDTIVLEFNTGLSARPILRPATNQESLLDGGTCIRVWLDISSNDSGGILGRHFSDVPLTLKELCSGLCPSLDVDIHTEENGKSAQAVSGSDWLTCKGTELLERVLDKRMADSEPKNDDTVVQFLEKAQNNLRLLVNDDGEVVGRACIADEVIRSRENRFDILKGVVTVGGLTATTLSGIVGVLTGTSQRASRDLAVPNVSGKTLAAWASEQATLVQNLYSDPKSLESCAEIIHRCGGNLGGLPIARHKGNWLSFDQISADINLPDEILMVSQYFLDDFEGLSGFRYEDNVFVVEHGGWRGVLQSKHSDFDWPDDLVTAWPKEAHFFQQTLGGAVLLAAAKSWGVSVESVLNVSDIEERNLLLVAHVNNQKVERHVAVVRKPK